MKYELPKKILEKKIVSAKESADFYEVDATAHPSTSLPIPTTRFQTEFLQLAEQLKEKVGMASARKRVERPKNNTKLDSKGNLIGDVDTEEDGDGEINRIDLKDRAKTVYEGSQKAKRADEEINDNDFVIKNGVLVEYRGTSEDVTIPNSVKEISDYAFNDNNLTNVTIPNSVTKIGSYAFYDNKLTYVDIPDSVTEIGEGAFDKNKLTDVTISNRATIIGDYAFNSNKLTSIAIPNSVTKIGDYAFLYNRLTSVTIPSSVTKIGNGAFDDNVNIIRDRVKKRADEEFNNNDFEIKDGVLIKYNGNSKQVVIPDGVTKIGRDAFYDNNLTSVDIPNSVTEIGSYAFYHNKLTRVTIPNSVTKIGNYAFAWNKLTRATIPNSVTEIGNRPFDMDVDIINEQGNKRAIEEHVVNESVKRPNFKRKSKEVVLPEEGTPIKDERDSMDKQPKEAVACENSDWTKLTVREHKLIEAGDKQGIRNKIPSKRRQKYLLDRMAAESAAHESTAMEGDEEEDVKYYIYEFYEDGSLGNTAYSDLFQASGAYQKSELPKAFVARNDDNKEFGILERDNLSEEQEVSLIEALNVLNEDGKPMIADEAAKGNNKNLFINKNSGGGSKLVIRNEQIPRNESIKVSKEELGIEDKKKAEEQGSEENYMVKNLQEDSLLRNLDGRPTTFSTIDKAEKFAKEEMGLLDEDFEVITKEAVPAKESISTTWYALVATESNKKIDSVVVNSDKPATREEAKKHLEKTYGKKAVYSVDSKPIKL